MNTNTFPAPVLTRCEECRKICLCHVECVCMATTVEQESERLLCHDCTDRLT